MAGGNHYGHCAYPRAVEFCSRDVCAILLLGDNNYRPNIVIASTYMPADEDPPPREFARLVEYCAGEGLELIAGTDCNAHHPLWGMPTAITLPAHCG
ncbi:unnamed protein product [Colias eurytheme]|nr:unnamed protein product [Colias eurytheme]